ncbi:Clathrin heavy chain 1 [Porphyridium purpureum]|uniref:Clathrin heavy chain n=1 Tax=Porphyridium purpureum TaxID=35688 RepID=A0A5J4Z8P1_PORPP|nr:Clathrin heavy chain 1 [Porphyridium purpureum]|eukprot:POR5987..scf295_1
MARQPPVVLKELFNLSSIGVSPLALTFAACRVQSDKYVVVRETLPNGLTQLVVVDTSKPLQPHRKPVQAQMAVMNPEKPVIALLFSGSLQMFDMAKKVRIKACSVAEKVVYMTWGGVNTLCIVTEQSVFQWRMDDAADPIKALDRHESTTKNQVLDFVADSTGSWMAVVGIMQGPSGVVGQIQLYSKEKNMTQMLEGHAASFRNFRYEGEDILLFAFAASSSKGSKLHVVQLGSSKVMYGKKACDIFYPPEARGDFPVAMVGSSVYPSVIYLVTKMGYVHIFDIESCCCIYVNRVSDVTLFTVCAHSKGGVMGVNRRGQALLFAPNEATVVPYILAKLKDVPMAIRFASRNGFEGVEQHFRDQFEELMDQKKLRDAAVVAADSPRGFLRTPATMDRFGRMESRKDEVNPLLLYLQTVLDRAGKLNKHESIAIGLQIVRANKAHLLEKWVREERLAFCEELGDLLSRSSLTMALAVFIKCEAHEKVIGCLAAMNQVNKVWAYAEKVGLKVTKHEIVEMAAKVNPQAALQLANVPLTATQAAQQNAIVLAKRKRKSNVDHAAMVDMFMKRGLLKEATSYCLDNLTDDADDEQEAKLQTRILEANLMNNPSVADAILKQDIWHQFDAFKVAILCERVGFFQHALELFTDLADIKRVMMNTHVLSQDALLNFFGQLDPDDALDVLDALVKSNTRANLALCVRIAAKYSDHLGALRIIGIFEALKQKDALYHYLQAIVNFSDEPEVHHRYLEASMNLGQYDEVERVTRESNFYDPEKVKHMLIRAKLKDPRPLINVCDRFGFVAELVRYMIKQNQLKFVEGYVTRVNPMRAPVVVGVLLDLQVDNKAILKLLAAVKNHLNVAELAEEVGKRGKLRLIQPVLESRVADGSTEPQVHTAIGMVYVDIGLNPEHFLQNNAYYDSRQLGAFCAKRGSPELAYIAFARGKCDAEVVDITNEAQLFKQQAVYVVERESDELYARILQPQNPYRKHVMDQIANVVLPASSKPEQVSCAVKAFLAADLPDALMELLEKLVFDTSNTAFSRNKNLQNLLLLTAIKAQGKSDEHDPMRSGRVMEYLRRMENYDSLDIAKVCVGAGLHEEAYTIYYKFDRLDDALDVLLENMKDFERAEQFAARLDKPAVWSKLGEALLRAVRVGDGVKALLKAKDARPYLLVIETAQEHASDEEYAIVTKYLRIIRGGIKGDRKLLDTELTYGLCRSGKLHEVQEFLSGRNDADLDEVAERVFDEENWEAAKLLMTLTKNWDKLARTLCELGDFDAALDAAKKAKRLEVWKFVCFKAVDAKPEPALRVAQKAGLHVVVEPEHMYDVVELYESRGYFDALLALMDAALLLERSHQALFTETGVLYTKYRPETVMDFAKMWWRRCNVPTFIRACERAALWEEVVYLQIQYEEVDNAASTMMYHPTAWSAAEFIDIMAKAGALETMYRGVQFYASQHPDLLLDLLLVLAPKVEASRVVQFLRAAKGTVASDAALFGPELGLLPACVTYLQKVVSIHDADTPPPVIEALIDVYVAEEAVLHLKDLVESSAAEKHFDGVALAKRLEANHLLAFRRLAGSMWRKTGKFEAALALAKQDGVWRDAVDTAAASGDPELCEELAGWFLDTGRSEAFTAMLYSCYEAFPPDVAMELAWTRGATSYAMPFLLQNLREVGARLIRLKTERDDKKEILEMQEKMAEEEVNEDDSVLLYGLNPSQQQNRMLALPGIGNPGMGGGRGGGGPMLQLGWRGAGGGGGAMNQYSTFAMPQMSVAPANLQSQYRTNMMQSTYQTNMMQKAYQTNMMRQQQQAQAQYQTNMMQNAYRTNVLQQAYATRAAQEGTR